MPSLVIIIARNEISLSKGNSRGMYNWHEALCTPVMYGIYVMIHSKLRIDKIAKRGGEGVSDRSKRACIGASDAGDGVMYNAQVGSTRCVKFLGRRGGGAVQ
jgi:hypothetical protein